MNCYQETKFTPLNNEQVINLLNTQPELKNLDAAQGAMKAYDSILNIQQEGIPSRLKEFPLANNELKNSMQFILFKINQEKSDEKKKELLLELARCVEDCVPVTQGMINKMHMKLASTGGVAEQINYFILDYKDRIVDQVIYELYPEMQDINYADSNYHKPWMQFPHIKTGFLFLLGEKLGLNTKGAKEDANKNTALRKEEFENKFYEKLSIHDVIDTFIKDVNGRHGQIDLDILAKWCIPDNLGEETANEIFDTEDFSPHLTEKAAYMIFEKLGFIVRSPELTPSGEIVEN